MRRASASGGRERKGSLSRSRKPSYSLTPKGVTSKSKADVWGSSSSPERKQRAITPKASSSRSKTERKRGSKSLTRKSDSKPSKSSTGPLPRLGPKSRSRPSRKFPGFKPGSLPSLDAKRSSKSSLESKTKGKKSGILAPQLPEHEGRLCVVLDMDETLIHSEFCKPNDYRQAESRQTAKRKSDFTLSLSLSGSLSETINVYKRPGLHEFLNEVSKRFELIIFTAALPIYAKPVLDEIDPKNEIVHRLYREATVIFKGQPFVKDLGVLGRSLKRIVLVDNNPCAMIARPDNSIPILSYYDDPYDQELPKIMKLLRKIENMQDVRPFLRKRFQLRENLAGLLR